MSNKKEWTSGSKILKYKQIIKGIQLFDSVSSPSQYGVFLGINMQETQLFKRNIQAIKDFIEEYQQKLHSHVCDPVFAIIDVEKSIIFLTGGQKIREKYEKIIDKPFILQGKLRVRSWQISAFKSDIMSGWSHMLSKFDFATKQEIQDEIRRVLPNFDINGVSD